MTQPAEETNNKTDWNNSIIAVDLSVAEPPKFVEPRGGQGLILYGEDNLYPNYLINLYESSPKHGSIINHKVRYATGKGWAVKKLGKSLGQISGFMNLIKKKNSKGDNLKKLAKKCYQDYEIFNGYCYGVIWQKNRKSVSEIYHLHFGLIRKFIEGKGDNAVVRYAYLPDWTNVRNLDQAKSKQGYKEFDAYDPETGSGTQIYYYSEPRPIKSGESDAYPIPYYIGAIPYIETDVEVSYYCANGIQNEFWGSQMITFTNGSPQNEEQKRVIEQTFNKRYGGTKNARRVIINFVDDEKQKPIVDKLSQEKIGEQFEQLNKQVREEIFTAHSVTNPAIFGVSNGESNVIGGSKQDRIADYDLFDATWTKPRQEQMEESFNDFFESQGMHPELYLITSKPYDIEFSEAVVKEFMDKEDIRELVYKQVGITPKADRIGVNLSKDGIDHLVRLASEGDTISPDEIIDSFKVNLNVTNEPDNSDAGYRSLYFAKLFDINFTDLEADIISLINSDPKITPDAISQALDVEVSEVNKTIKKLTGLKVITGTVGESLKITEAGEKSIRKSDKELSVEVRYTYSDEGAPPLAPGSSSRPFCLKLMELAKAGKVWTRKQIDAMKNENGDSAWIYRGGFYHNAEDGETTPFCRHHWKAVIIKRRS